MFKCSNHRNALLRAAILAGCGVPLVAAAITSGATVETADTVALQAEPGVQLVSDRINRTGASGTDPLYDSHASTIVQTADGNLLMAYFNGAFEGADNQCIYISSRTAGSDDWSTPVEVAGNPNGSISVDDGIAMYNPVLFQPVGGPLFLYYKQGTPSTWAGYYITSTNDGQSWSSPVALPTNVSAYGKFSPYNNVVGPVRSKPLQLADGTILFGSDLENDTAGYYYSYIQRSTSATDPFGSTNGSSNWTTTAAINSQTGSIQPTFLYHGGTTIEALTRQYSGAAGTQIGVSWSYDDGVTWSAVAATAMPNNWSGIEGLGLADGRYLLVCNPDNTTSAGNGRNLLVALISSDGTNWHAALQLQDAAASTADEFDYPAAIQTTSGQIQITYSYNHAGIRNVTVDPSQIKGLPLNTSKPTDWVYPALFYNMVTDPAYANLTEDDAGSNSGYISKGAAVSGNSFGYQTTQHAEGYNAGEIGGTFNRSAVGDSYFGRALGGTFNQSSNLMATGQVYKTSGTGTTDLYLGFFKSTDTGKTDFVGLDFSGTTATAQVLDNLGGNDASLRGETSQSVTNSTAYQYSMIWTPASATSTASLLIVLANGSNTQTTWNISGASLAGFDGDFNVDSFGLFSNGDGTPAVMTAYIDDNAVGAAAVPEPAGLLTAVIGGATLLRRRSRRSRPIRSRPIR